MKIIWTLIAVIMTTTSFANATSLLEEEEQITLSAVVSEEIYKLMLSVGVEESLNMDGETSIMYSFVCKNRNSCKENTHKITKLNKVNSKLVFDKLVPLNILVLDVDGEMGPAGSHVTASEWPFSCTKTGSFAKPVYSCEGSGQFD